ncbi:MULTISPECIES: lipoprotein-releasing ABC transporter permease subunit [unclassified Pseudoalteromonas]|uniref:lipoprotein-releasing ABC transporter permease subunit n=1 Tax=unclassified Pseudoalteromonas TaxID=194690 RepID=UPI0030148F48
MLSYFLSKRFRESKRQLGFIGFLTRASTLGVMLGMAVLIVALSVINGFEEQLEQRLLSVVPQVSYEAPYEPIANWPSKVSLLEEHPNIVAATAEINLTAMLQFKGVLKAAQLKGIVPNLHENVSSVGEFVAEKPLSQLASGEIIIGQAIAKKLAVEVGDSIQLLVANRHADNPLAAPKRLTATVAGLVAMGGPLDQTLALLPIQDLQQAMAMDSTTVTGLRAKVSDVFQAHQIATQAGKTLPDLVYVSSWFRTQGGLYQDIQMVRTIVYLVVFLIIAVASFNIISSMVMEVKEKRADIAILKTMGAQDSTIFATFAMQGITYAAIGAIIGSVVGIFLAINIPELFKAWINLSDNNPLQGVYFIEYLPSKLVWTDIYISLAATFIMAAIASLYPAWQATKTDPAKVLGNG